MTPPHADLLESIVMPFGAGDGENGVQGRRRFRQDFDLDQRGRVSFILAPWEFSRDNAKAQRTKYGHYETGWVQSVSDERLIGTEDFGLSGGDRR